MSDAETRILRDAAGALELRLPGVRLSIVEGPDQGVSHDASRGTVRVGSSPDNDLVLSDPAASRHHAVIRLDPTGPTVRDLGSTNGTTVDGVRVREAYLGPASLVRLGDTSIRVTPVDEPVVIPLSSRTQLGRLIGSSAPMREAYAVLERAAKTHATVLIQGETGTGKELAAEAVHELSPRAEGPFITLDCGAVSPALLESTLFGHVRGAFTGAHADRRGAAEEAHGGTLFLDEVGELPLDLQPKLLRLLENREVRRVGESKPTPVDVRVVAATHRDLEGQVNRGAFREDLYFRLAVVQVSMPPLRARPEDIPALVRSFVEAFTPGAPPPSAELAASLAARPWPGNVRQLRNAVERALAMGAAADGEATSTPDGMEPDALLSSLLEGELKPGLERWTARFERRYLTRLMQRSGGSVTEAARIAGVSRKHVHRMLKRHGTSEDA